MKKTVTFFLLVLLSGKISAAVVEPYTYQHSQLTDSVKCDANPKISYSLYMPSNNSNKSNWPLLFVLRIYTAGFSGGARVASAIAIMYKGVTGVIDCCAGLPGVPSGTICSDCGGERLECLSPYS